MSDDSTQKCFAVLRVVVQQADTNGIPAAEDAVDQYLTFFPQLQQLAALEILEQECASLWVNPSQEQQYILETIGEYIAKRAEELRDRDVSYR